jgi:hypothetical protein
MCLSNCFEMVINTVVSMFVYVLQEDRARHHALEMDGLLSRQAWECLQSSTTGSTTPLAEDAAATLRSEVQSILHQLRDCIPQTFECP